MMERPYLITKDIPKNAHSESQEIVRCEEVPCSYSPMQCPSYQFGGQRKRTQGRIGEKKPKAHLSVFLRDLHTSVCLRKLNPLGRLGDSFG